LAFNPLSLLASVLERDESRLLNEWTALQITTLRRSQSEKDLLETSREFLLALRMALQQGASDDLKHSAWARVRSMLDELSVSRARQGYSPTETATFIYSLKRPIFDALRRDLAGDADALGAEVWNATSVLDQLGLYTVEAYQRGREAVIQRQQQEMMELSTPVVRLWEGILALPLIGTLDSARTQIVMQNLLEAVVANSASIAIIDITGVPTVDTLVAQHLLRTVAAARLMGADCIISGIRPQIAQTIIHLGVDLSDVSTKATLADAFQLALRRTNLSIAKAAPKTHGVQG
jgi:rsbT co-antagonist protein RsbR